MVWSGLGLFLKMTRELKSITEERGEKRKESVATCNMCRMLSAMGKCKVREAGRERGGGDASSCNPP